MKTSYLPFFVLIGYASGQEPCAHKYLVEKLDYSTDFGPYLTANGYTTHSSSVTAKCGKESHRFKCNNGTFEPTDPSKSKCRDCNPVAPKYGVQLKFDAKPVNGKYPEGTNVNGTCDGNLGIIDGASKSVCSDGKWTPEPGRCPYRCSAISILWKRKGYHTAYVEDPSIRRNSWFLHGTTAWAGCHYVPFIFTWYEWHCVDGGWQPSQPQYKGC